MKRGIRWPTVLIVVAVVFAFSSVVYAAGLKSPLALVKEAKAKIKEMSVQELKSRMDRGEKLILLDIREPEEYLAGHIKKAVNLPRGLLEFKVVRKYKNPDALMVIYCRTGGRASLATLRLQEMGYKNVYNLAGGFKAWGKAGYPVYNRHGEFIMKAFEKKEK